MSSVIWILVPITALMIPIVALLIFHQQKMAQIIHGRASDHEIEMLRAEIARLDQRVSDLSLALGGRSDLSQRVETRASISQQ